MINTELDILLVHPNASAKVYQDLSKDFSAIEPPIWAGMIAYYLRSKGFKVNVLDCEAQRLTVDQSFQEIERLNPRVVCLVVYGQQPSASTQNMVGATLLMNRISSLPCKRIYVGPHPSALPDRTINDDPTVLVAVGEGVYTIEDLLNLSIIDNDSLKTVRGLAYKDVATNKIVKNPPATLIKNLDETLPEVAWDMLPMEKYRTANWHGWTNNNNNSPFVSLYTSLGCPFQCTFCMINSPFNNGDSKNNVFRHWSPEHIIKTFDKFADMGITNVKIADEMFVFKPAHFLALCNLIIQRGYKFNIWAYARVDTIKEHYLEVLKKAGVNWLGLGIESGNFNIRQEITKGKFQVTNIHDIIAKINNSGICVTGNFIFGLPNDTYETMNETLNMAMDLSLDYVNFYCAMAYPGSQLHREISKSSPEVLPENNADVGWIGYSQHAYETYNLPTKSLKHWEVLKFRDDAFQKFFTNQTYINRMVNKLGGSFKNEVDRMLSVKLNRKYY